MRLTIRDTVAGVWSCAEARYRFSTLYLGFQSFLRLDPGKFGGFELLVEFCLANGECREIGGWTFINRGIGEFCGKRVTFAGDRFHMFFGFADGLAEGCLCRSVFSAFASVFTL